MSRRFQLSLRDQRYADLKTVLRLMAGLCMLLAAAAFAWRLVQPSPVFFVDAEAEFQAAIQKADKEQAEKEGEATLRKVYRVPTPAP